MSECREGEEEEEHLCAHEGDFAVEDGEGEDDCADDEQSFFLVLAIVSSELQCLVDGELSGLWSGGGSVCGRVHDDMSSNIDYKWVSSELMLHL